MGIDIAEYRRFFVFGGAVVRKSGGRKRKIVVPVNDLFTIRLAKLLLWSRARGA